MDLSTGKDIDRIRQAIIDASTVPIGTVPIYQMLEELGGDIEDMRPHHFIEMCEKQAQQGVDYMTVHAGLLQEHLALTTKRISRTRSTPISRTCATSSGSTTSPGASETGSAPARSPMPATRLSLPNCTSWVI